MIVNRIVILLVFILVRMLLIWYHANVSVYVGYFCTTVLSYCACHRHSSIVVVNEVIAFVVKLFFFYKKS